MPEEYLVASSVAEALAFLATRRGQAQLIAGGTELRPRIERGECPFSSFVDVSRIAVMKRVQQENSHLVLGGGATFTALADNELVAAQAPLIHRAVQLVASCPKRRDGTVAGAMVTAVGSAEISVALTALAAEVQVTNLTGEQWVPVASLFPRPGSCQVDSTAEMITAVRCRALAPDEGYALERIEPHAEGAYPAITLALLLALEADGDTVRAVTVAYGLLSGVPAVAPDLAALLVGQSVKKAGTWEAFRDGVGILVARSQPISATDARPSRQALDSLSNRALTGAVRAAEARRPELAPETRRPPK